MLYILFVIVCSFAMCSLFLKNRKRIVGVLLLFMFIVYVLSFIRWETGTDWDSYYEIFQNAKSIKGEFYVEPTFFLINYICHSVSDSYTFLLFVLATIIFFCTFNSFKNLSYPLIAYLIYFSTTFGDIMFVRQSISIAIVLYSFKYIFKKQKKKFIICSIIASCFHVSTIAVFPLYYIYHKNLKWKKVFFIFIVIFIISLYLSTNRTGVINLPFGLNNNYLVNRINTYILLSQRGYDSYLTLSPIQAITNHLIKRSILFILIFVYSSSKIIKDKYFSGCLRIYIYSSCLYLFFAPISLDLTRMTAAIEIVDILLFTKLLAQVRRTSNKIIIFLVILMFSCLKFSSNISRFPEIYSNYKTILS